MYGWMQNGLRDQEIKPGFRVTGEKIPQVGYGFRDIGRNFIVILYLG